eukprot:6283943-Ditylum_brightwellii.AAC.1
MGVPVPALSCAHLVITIHFLAVLVPALTCLTALQILLPSWTALKCVNPMMPENFEPKTTTKGK